MANQINAITGLPNRTSHLRENVVIDGTLEITGLIKLNNGTFLGSVPSAYSLGEASTYVILTPTVYTLTAPFQLVTGDVGHSGATVGGPIAFVSGSDIQTSPASQSILDAEAAYDMFTGLTPTFTFTSGAVVLETVVTTGAPGVFTPGVYKGDAAASTGANGVVTLSGDGDFVFIFDGALTTGADTVFVLSNGATANRVFFVCSGAVTTGANTTFKGTALTPAAITTGANTNLQGRIISFVAAISTGAVNTIVIAN